MENEGASQEVEISFSEVEKKFFKFLLSLEIDPSDDLKMKETYEKMEILFDGCIRKFEASPMGKDAAKILSILSFLSPREICAEMVNEIFSRLIFYPEPFDSQRFLEGDLELRVKRALKFLRSNFFIRIKTEKTTVGYSDFIRINRLVQRFTRNSKSELIQPMLTLQVIADYFARNDDYGNHISTFLKSQEEARFRLENLIVLPLIVEYTLTVDCDWKRDEVVEWLSSREWNDEEKLVVTLIKIKAGIISMELEEIKELMLALPKELINRAGLTLELCTAILEPCIKDFDHFDGPDRRVIQSWLKKCFVEGPYVKNCSLDLMRCVYAGIDIVFDSEDGKFVSKVFTNERERVAFWGVFNDFQDNIVMGLLPYFFPSSGEKNLFVRSLEFQTREAKMEFLNFWVRDLKDCVIKVIGNDEMREKLLGTQDFTRALRNITRFSFREIRKILDEGAARGILRLLSVWLALFSAHEDTYQNCGRLLDLLMENLSNSLIDRLLNKWTHGLSWTEFGELSRKFTSLQYCSRATRFWINKLLQECVPYDPGEESPVNDYIYEFQYSSESD